jgi:hypothetical protein
MSELEQPMDHSPAYDEVRENERAYSLSVIQRAASWFFWIAGLSIINTVIALFSDSTFSFLAGLGMTQMVDSLVLLWNEGLAVVATVINLLIAGVYVFIGIKARQAIKAAFIIGLILYALDALIFLNYRLWLPFLFHIFAGYMIFRGLRETDKYHAM